MNKLYRLSRPELDFLKENCNFSEEESILFDMTSKRCSDIQIADKLGVSTSTVTKRKCVLCAKIKDFIREMDTLTTVYINGKKVSKEEMQDYEVHIDQAKKIMVGKLTRKSK
jgi:hypothetical protein